jgi:hypothetical protein
MATEPVSSAKACVDPDRVTIKYFENGGAHSSDTKIEIVSAA